MSRFILGRSHYWTWVAVLMTLKLALVALAGDGGLYAERAAVGRAGIALLHFAYGST
ncbi:MAG: hypothetical protein IT537_01190 [Hyphomicrobiales bacterium]|nr:hypothetical protein [Hyphomicrobiales bacterium]